MYLLVLAQCIIFAEDKLYFGKTDQMDLADFAFDLHYLCR